MEDNNKKTVSLEELLRLEGENNKNENIVQNEDKKRYNREELKQAKKENKFYLPVLSLNDAQMWPSKPLSQRRHFTDEQAAETCLTNCCNEPGLWSACCRLDPDDLEHVLGPVDEKWIKSTLVHFKKKGFKWTRQDLVIDFEEGKLIGDKFFNGHPIFSKTTSYPMIRFQVIGHRFGCKFLNPDNGMCGIYNLRPDMCRNYYCQYVKTNFLVRTKDRPNTYTRIDTKGR